MAQDKDRIAALGSLHTAVRAFTSQVTFYNEAVASAVGLHPTDLDCFSVVEIEGPLTAGRLVDVTGLTSGAVTGVIDRLERAGFVVRTADREDRRRVLVQVVDGAPDRIAAAFDDLHRASAVMTQRYTNDDLAIIADYMTRSVPVLREETLRLRDPLPLSAADVDDVVVPGTSAPQATLRFVNGAARLTIDTAENQRDLFTAKFQGGRPTTRQEGDAVIVQYRRSPLAHFRTRGTITLDAARTWSIETAQGLANCSFDLAGTTVDSFRNIGGMSSVDIALPRPQGVLRVDIRGGVHAVTISRPAGVAATVSIKGGAANLVLDAKRFGAIGGGIEIESDGAASAEDRVEVAVRGGSSSLSVVTRSQT
jgi:DNA-binding MarR family transcriptional regulator